MPDGRTQVPVNRRRFLTGSALLASGAVAAPLLASCDAGSGGSGSDNGKTTLTVMYASNELTKEHIAAFESRNPDIKIQLIENDEARLNAMLASGKPPDFVRGAAVGSANNNARGLAADLDPYLDKSTVLKKDDLLPVNDNWRWDGKRIGAGPYYGITKDWSQDATLWYNKALFAQAKVPELSTTEPVTYDQLLDIARRLAVQKDGKTVTYGLGIEWQWGLSGPLFSMVLSQGGRIYNDDLTETDLTTAEAKRALQWLVDLAQSGAAPSSLNPLPDGADLSTFMAGRMAVTQDGYWYGGNFIKAPADLQANIRMAPAPVMGNKRVSPCYAGQGAWIPAKSKNKDAAWKLMEYFMAGPPAEERATSGWGLPALKSLLPKLPQEQPYQKEAYLTAQAELAYNVPMPDSPYVTTANWISTLNEYVDQAVRKTITVDVAAQKVTDDVNKLLKQGKDRIG
ncbi:ABC transporter substrate-binding protein [Virgisporangium aurantiacum]|uniref:Sugar ABC transporter substrate-binding protein n=1 Tax=Virgisporangium aurantiacum TaxID=175570 RepID=A0A8J3ZKF7_9ACTN|nr:sugar ABC transporter substrate-binding protein [Virgisporangium aurantiacum]GIJ64597.1 sugar ABC transporter substrate-binding protein [Virgisporangium aurantiacum]